MSIDRLMEEMGKIAEDAREVIRLVMSSQRGINDKVGRNTLIDSNVYKQIDISYENVGIVEIFVNQYIDYIEGGRKSGSFPPPRAIMEWASRKGIPTDNRTIYAICMSIYKYGISPRPIFDAVYEEWERHFDEWADNLFKALIEDLDAFFNE